MRLIDIDSIDDDTLYAYGFFGEAYDVREMLASQPTVDAIPVRHGKWRHYERMLTCSECGTVFDDDIMEYFGEEAPKYCPECGAKMDGEQEAQNGR